MPEDSRPIVVLSTAGSLEEGERLARALVEERLAACVNVVPGMRSIYRWRGAMQAENEVLLLVKTTAERFDELRARVRMLHSYELPELVVLEPRGGDADYLDWVREESART